MLSNSLFTENSESVVPESPRAEERDAVHSGSHMLSIACRISVRVGTTLHAGELPFVLPCSYQEGKQSELKASPLFIFYPQIKREAVQYALWEGGHRCQRSRALGKGTGNASDVGLF